MIILTRHWETVLPEHGLKPGQSKGSGEQTAFTEVFHAIQEPISSCGESKNIQHTAQPPMASVHTVLLPSE